MRQYVIRRILPYKKYPNLPQSWTIVSSQIGDIVTLDYLVRDCGYVTFDDRLVGSVLENAVQYEHETIIDYILPQRQDDSIHVTCHAAKLGKYVLVEKYCKLISTCNYITSVMWQSVSNGHKEITKFLLSRHRTLCKSEDTCEMLRLTLEGGSKIAASHGHYEIVRYLMKQGVQNVDDALIGASHRGDISMMCSYITLGANSFADAQHEAVTGGKLNALLYLSQYRAVDWNASLISACISRRHDIVDYIMLHHGASITRQTINKNIHTAVILQDWTLICVFIDSADTLTLRTCLKSVDKNDQQELIGFLEKKIRDRHR